MNRRNRGGGKAAKVESGIFKLATKREVKLLGKEDELRWSISPRDMGLSISDSIWGLLSCF